MLRALVGSGRDTRAGDRAQCPLLAGGVGAGLESGPWGGCVACGADPGRYDEAGVAVGADRVGGPRGTRSRCTPGGGAGRGHGPGAVAGGGGHGGGRDSGRTGRCRPGPGAGRVCRGAPGRAAHLGRCRRRARGDRRWSGGRWHARSGPVSGRAPAGRAPARRRPGVGVGRRRSRRRVRAIVNGAHPRACLRIDDHRGSCIPSAAGRGDLVADRTARRRGPCLPAGGGPRGAGAA